MQGRERRGAGENALLGTAYGFAVPDSKKLIANLFVEFWNRLICAKFFPPKERPLSAVDHGRYDPPAGSIATTKSISFGVLPVPS
jgi:hypothetical protein